MHHNSFPWPGHEDDVVRSMPDADAKAAGDEDIIDTRARAALSGRVHSAARATPHENARLAVGPDPHHVP
jgi:hypothetical protein